MNKKRALLVVLCCALVGAFFVFQPTRAQSYSYTVDFDGGYSNYSIVYGSVGSGGNSGNALNGVKVGSIFYGEIDITACDYGIYGLSYQFKGVNQRTYHDITHYDWLNPGQQQLNGSGGEDGMANGVWHSVSRVGYAANSATGATIYIAWSAATGSDSLYIDNITVTCRDVPDATNPPPPTAVPSPTNTPMPAVAEWNKPLRSSDQKYDDVSFHPGRSFLNMTGIAFLAGQAPYYLGYNFNLGFTNAQQSDIYAAHSGIISSVSAIGDCLISDLGMAAGTCQIYWDVQPSATAYFAQIDQAYLITEELSPGGLSVRYLVTSPLVASGDTVTGGCLIGKSLPIKGFGGGDLGYGAAIIQGLQSDQTTTFDLSPYLVSEPSGTACHVSTTSPCALVANADFLNGRQGWESNPAYPDLPLSISPFGMGLSFPGSAQQTLNLDSAQQYKVTIYYSSAEDAPPQTIFMQLGTTIGSIPLDPGMHNERSTAAQLWTPDQANGLYTFGIYAPAGSADKSTIEFACVSESGAAPPSPSGGCIVLDPFFNLSFSSSPWTVSTSPPAVIPGGMAVIPDTATISQAITLNPADGGGNFNYDLQVTYRRQGIASPGDDISLDWAFGGQSGSLTPAKADQIWSDYTGTFGIATLPVTDDLVITGVGSDSQQVAQVSKICIVAHDGGSPPGYQPPAPFEGGCRYCVYSPTGDAATDISEFQQWLACQLYQLWECQAKILLRYIWQALINILTLFGFFRLWLSATLINLVQWGNGNLVVFANWLYGQINNAAQQIIYAILTLPGGGGSGTNLWDFLIALINGIFGLLQVFVQLVANIMQLIISGVIGFLVNGVGLLLGLLQSVINGLNTAPATINAAWLPNCNDATSGLFVVCSAIYGVESGLAIGPFQYLVPIGVGLGALNLLWWGIAKIKGVFTE